MMTMRELWCSSLADVVATADRHDTAFHEFGIRTTICRSMRSIRSEYACQAHVANASASTSASASASASAIAADIGPPNQRVEFLI